MTKLNENDLLRKALQRLYDFIFDEHRTGDPDYVHGDDRDHAVNFPADQLMMDEARALLAGRAPIVAPELMALKALLTLAKEGLECAVRNAKAKGDDTFLGYVMTLDQLNLTLGKLNQ